jgi:hypothetical protein
MSNSYERDAMIDNYRAVTYRIPANILYLKLVPYAEEIIIRIQRSISIKFLL